MQRVLLLDASPYRVCMTMLGVRGDRAVLRFVDVVAELHDGTGLSLAENMQVGQPL